MKKNKIFIGILITVLALIIALAKIGRVPISIEPQRSNNLDSIDQSDIEKSYEKRRKTMSYEEIAKEEEARQRIKDELSPQPDYQ